ncbi:MAG: GGDEF domain-containing protein [Gaiellaceae bacterium]
MGSFRVKLVAYFVLLAFVPLAAAFWGFTSIAARSETRQADARLQSGLRAAVAAYDVRLASAQARADTFAHRADVARALARHDRVALASLLPAGLRVVAPGLRVGAAPRGQVAERAVTVYDQKGLLGRVVASVPLDATFARQLSLRAGLAGGDRVAFVRAPAPVEPQTIRVAGVSYRAVAAPPLEVLTPQARIDAASARMEHRLLAALLGTLVLVGLVAWLEGMSIVRSVRRLVQAANAIAQGDLARRVPVSGRDELAGLASSFNEMAAQLGARLEELESERGRLQDAITLFGEALAATHDVEQLLRIVLDAELEATGASGGLVIVDGGIAAQAGTFGGDDRIEVPLRAGRTSFGRLILSGKRFTDDERMTAASLAAHAVVALDNARLHRIVEHQALVDGLTGLANRRHGERVLETELARAERFGGPLAFVLCDLDNFKEVNDRHGHLVGDDVLRELALVLEETVRSVDVAARWGGEEFALILTGTGGEGAVLLAERAREALAGRTILTQDGVAVTVTASFGVAAFPAHGGGADLVAAADAALYRAKRAGKNRVETAPWPPPVRSRS